MGRNSLGDEGTIAVCNTLKNSKVSKLEELIINRNDIGADGAKAIAAYCAVSASLTSLNLALNELCGIDKDDMGTYHAEGIQALADALRVSSSSPSSPIILEYFHEWKSSLTKIS